MSDCSDISLNIFLLQIKRPDRLCIFRNKMISNSKLTRHIKHVHKFEERVIAAFSAGAGKLVRKEFEKEKWKK